MSQRSPGLLQRRKLAEKSAPSSVPAPAFTAGGFPVALATRASTNGSGAARSRGPAPSRWRQHGGPGGRWRRAVKGPAGGRAALTMASPGLGASRGSPDALPADSDPQGDEDCDSADWSGSSGSCASACGASE